MDGLPVAVEIAPPDAPRENVSALLAACSRVLADAACVPATETPENGSRAVAIVTWQGEDRARVEVGLRIDGRNEWRTRTLDFEANDELLERWRTVGFVVGTLSRPELADKPEQEPVPAPPSRPEPEPARLAPVPAPPPPPPPRSLGVPPLAAIDLGAVTGPAFDGRRTGGLLRTRWPIGGPLRALITLRYLERPADSRELTARWLTAAAGPAAVAGSEHLEIAFAADVRAQYFGARAGQTSDHRVLPGVALGATGAWMPVAAFGAFVGGEVAWIFDTTAINVDEQRVGTDEALRFSAEAGVRLRLW